MWRVSVYERLHHCFWAVVEKMFLTQRQFMGIWVQTKLLFIAILNKCNIFFDKRYCILLWLICDETYVIKIK